MFTSGDSISDLCNNKWLTLHEWDDSARIKYICAPCLAPVLTMVKYIVLCNQFTTAQNQHESSISGDKLAAIIMNTDAQAHYHKV